MALLIPSSFATAAADAIASFEPDSTCCAAELTFAAPKFPVLSNVTGKPHSSDPGEIKAMMLEQVTGTTNWAADVAAAKELGCTTFVEFGPGKVLSGLIAKIDASLVTANVADLASLAAAAERV